MGNSANTIDKNKCIGYGKLTIQQYPGNITEEEWLPSESCNKSKQNQETKISGALKGDGRIRAQPHDYINADDKNGYKNAIYNIVRLKMAFNSGLHTCGSGVIIHHTLNKSFVLTAAHNIVYEDGDEKLQYATSTWIEINENTSNGFKTIKQYKCSEYMIHPKYIEFLQKEAISESDTGYDIAVIQVCDAENQLKQIKPIRMRAISSKMADNMKIKVIGYPGEKKLRGELYGMKGDATIKIRSSKSSYNELIVYKNIDTTHGQSGCPIFRVFSDEKKESGDNIYKSFEEIIGVHMLGKRMKKSNFGTLLSDEIVQWIHEYIDGDCNKYDSDSCDFGVLLITSSKSKYAHRLNQIHKKCLKTEVMSTMKLYYDYSIEKSVHKQHFLSYIRRLFEEKKKWYLIFYCGESDENGNWIISDNKSDNVTLDDISICAKQKHKRSGLQIVSDCSQSGNWVQEWKQKKAENIQCIQASSKPNEACNAGTFTSKYAQCCFGYLKREEKIVVIVGRVGIGGLAAVTVGTLYDGGIKQPFHKASKQSQPTSTRSGRVGPVPDYVPIYSRDKKYRIKVFGFDSWYEMDSCLTVWTSGAVTGSMGLY